MVVSIVFNIFSMSQTGMVRTENDILGMDWNLPPFTSKDMEVGFKAWPPRTAWSWAFFHSWVPKFWQGTSRGLTENWCFFWAKHQWPWGRPSRRRKFSDRCWRHSLKVGHGHQGFQLCERWVKEVGAFIEERLEVKLPTIWTVEKQRWEESEKRKSRKKEDSGARKGRKVAELCFSNDLRLRRVQK